MSQPDAQRVCEDFDVVIYDFEEFRIEIADTLLNDWRVRAAITAVAMALEACDE